MLSHMRRSYAAVQLRRPVLAQVESRCTPRATLPVPAAGSLPLPAGLPTLKAAFEPRSVEDLNAVVPEGAPKLAAPAPPEAPVCTGFAGNSYKLLST
jgi:hypothetical protein